MHPRNVAEPELKVDAQAFFDTWLFPMVTLHEELKVFREEGNRTSM